MKGRRKAISVMDPHRIRRLNLQGYQSKHQADDSARDWKACLRHRRYGHWAWLDSEHSNRMTFLRMRLRLRGNANTDSGGWSHSVGVGQVRSRQNWDTRAICSSSGVNIELENSAAEERSPFPALADLRKSLQHRLGKWSPPWVTLSGFPN